MRKAPGTWRLANVILMYKKGQKDDSWNQRPVSPTLVPGKVMEQVIHGIRRDQAKPAQKGL